MDQDTELSVTSPGQRLPLCGHVPHHIDEWLTYETVSKPTISTFFDKNYIGHGVSSQQ